MLMFKISHKFYVKANIIKPTHYNRMVEYLKTKKGYFYKLKKNGEKKRVSQEEYNKKNKKVGGDGEPIDKSDILYKDEFVCILKPNVKKGIIVSLKNLENLNMYELGLKTKKELGLKPGEELLSDYFIFSAPYYSKDIDYKSVEKELINSYGKKVTQFGMFIRVNPDETYVFSKELRSTIQSSMDFYKSKKTLTDYLRIIKENAVKYKKYKKYKDTHKASDVYDLPVFDLKKSTLISFSNDRFESFEDKVENYNTTLPIQENSEILVKSDFTEGIEYPFVVT
jgi:hypothetical protein